MTRALEKTRVQQRADKSGGRTKSERDANPHSFPGKDRLEEHKERQFSEPVASLSYQPPTPPRADRAGCHLPQSAARHAFRLLRVRYIPLRVLAHRFLSPHPPHAEQKGNLCHETHRGRNLSRQVAMPECSLFGLDFFYSVWTKEKQF